MSDGISEGYRAARASDRFNKLWTDAQVEAILLDIKSNVETLSTLELYEKLINETNGFRISHSDGWEIPEWWGVQFRSSINPDMEHLYPKVRMYKLEVSDSMHRSYSGKDLNLLIKEALIFVEWCKTEEGKQAVEVYNDW